MRLIRSPARAVLGSLESLIAVAAFGGGVYGLSGAEGLPVAWLSGSPFRDFTLPSLFLFIVVGGSFLWGAYAVFAGKRYARKAAAAAGLVLLLWITVQVAVIGYVSWLQPAMVASALLVWLLSVLIPA
ncbi:MAG: hypothetical protein ABIW76_24330 [Fibrobacteria bacterium]